MKKDYFEKYDEEKLLNNLKHADGKVYFRGTLADLSNCTFSKILEKAERARINRIARAKATAQTERYLSHFDFIENHKNKAKELESAFSEYCKKQETTNAPKRFINVYIIIYDIYNI